MLQVNHLNKQFSPQKKVIADLSLRIEPGERTCIFAPSGSGKSALLRILSGLDHHYQGHFHISTSRLGVVFQEPALFWYKTLKDNILYTLKLKRVPTDRSIRKKLEEWLEITGLSEFEHYYPYMISGGMKQKAAIIRCFLHSPQMILLDEPFHSIDIQSKSRIIEYILQIKPSPTVLMTTHNLDEIPLLADHLLLFRRSPLSDFQSITISPEISVQALTTLVLKS